VLEQASSRGPIDRNGSNARQFMQDHPQLINLPFEVVLLLEIARMRWVKTASH
jgi:hypothetical protein